MLRNQDQPVPTTPDLSMHELFDHIFYTDSDQPFGNDTETRAFLVIQQNGNLLFYSSSKIEQHFEFIREHNGLASQYLTHRDEASEYCDKVREEFDAPLVCHEKEKAAISEKCTVDEVFDERGQHAPDLEVIPTPGHCPGSSCYQVIIDGVSYLFTGDTIYLEDGSWKIYMKGSQANPDDMRASLQLMREMNVDVVIPGVSSGGIIAEEVKRSRWQQLIDNCLAQLD